MKQIKDLTADELAEYALYVFILSGRHQMGAALIYRCLELEPKHPAGLRNLSDFLDGKGSEMISAVVMEYLIKHYQGPAERKKEYEDILFLSKWAWGFSKHHSGQTELGADDFVDQTQFTTDDAAYDLFLEVPLSIAGTAEKVVQGAHNLVGVYAGGLHSPSLIETHKPIDILLLNDFEKTPAYTEFLELDVRRFEEAKAQVKQMR